MAHGVTSILQTRGFAHICPLSPKMCEALHKELLWLNVNFDLYRCAKWDCVW